MPKKETWEEKVLQRRESMNHYTQTIINGKLILCGCEMKEQKKIQKATINSPFNFLQYLGLVCRWAINNYDISRSDLEFLLYLHPVGIFNQKQFKDIESHYGIRIYNRFEKFRDRGVCCFSLSTQEKPFWPRAGI